MKREEMKQRLNGGGSEWDVVIIGGGATGVGAAVDAASRGYRTLLLEQSDFGKGTSSRSTKLVHGGVRYLQQGNVSLVMEALKERGIMRVNAPHLVSDQRFIVPNYTWWEAPFYGIGLKLYDVLAGKYGFGPSTYLNKEKTLNHIPTLVTDGLIGGVQYFDGQFDDARLLINMAQTAAEQGAVMLNYARVTGIDKGDDGFVSGVQFEDMESGESMHVSAKAVINATGPFTDDVLKMDDPNSQEMISPSQGVHIVLESKFLTGDTAIMVPHTKDGRVMFAIPWHGHVVVGTTDTPIEESSLEPKPMSEEIDFILETASGYLNEKPSRDDILSAFAGIRPLVKAGGGDNTAALSRDHTIHIGQSGLITICGGKWTTYRNMAEDVVNHAETVGHLEERPCMTKNLNIHGYHSHPETLKELAVYGSDAHAIRDLMRTRVEWAEQLHPALPHTAAEVVWSCRMEMARTVDDVLSRRTRSLLLNAKASIEMAPKVAALMAEELGRDEAWQQQQIEEYTEMAQGYLV
ncbi:glycerol-3-phosphate dehydrogenase/oxidase [Verrucomicrobiaceae bacterium N1E253]|uniref:Glycerol-3-phosphate dehydrogenase n=1 Tax=Oceaniferula marina TaxID=2748318 RepID=A0A851GR10_9BACT|nr:glycerol-3-phosphate dehydrogenase/oxidase [Oceaniferula marina]NWK57555.1 glycerol-3-phosphate dehydrogenase/oxidase [Oceaniferula marina]